jgi:hypothetical protein
MRNCPLGWCAERNNTRAPATILRDQFVLRVFHARENRITCFFCTRSLPQLITTIIWRASVRAVGRGR